MSQFLSKEQATSYEKNRIESLDRENKSLLRAKAVMSQEDYESYSKLILEPLPTVRQMELEVKYGFIKKKNCLC